MSSAAWLAEDGAGRPAPPAARRPPDVRELRRAFGRDSPGGRWAGATILLGAAALTSALASLVLPEGTRGQALATALVLAPLAASAACFGARAAADMGGRAPWLLFGIGSMLPALGHALSSAASLRGLYLSFPSHEFHLVVLFHFAFAEGAVLALRPAQEPRLAVEIALDGLLVLLGTSLLVLVWILDEPLAQGWLTTPQAVGMLVGQFAVGASLLFAALLVFWRDTELDGPVVDGLLVTAVFLAFGHFFVALGLDPLPGVDQPAMEWVRLSGWLALGLTAALAMIRPEAAIPGQRRELAARRFRQLIIPTAALFVTGWAVQAVRAENVSNTSRVVVGVMGVLLALRVGAALYAVERESEDRRTAERQAGRARLRAVTAQMNPHFLFNALHSLSALVRRDTQASEDALERLGGLLRYGLDSGDHPVRFREEWGFARDYLALESLRLGTRLEVREEIDEDVMDLAVPPFVIQPLVENAVRYAVSPFPSGGWVAVRARQRGGALVLEVADSGPGASEDAVANAPGVGLRGVRAQLATHFGEEWRMDVAHDGTEFRIRLTMPADDD